MKTQFILKTVFCLAGFSAFALTGSAQAQVINVNIDGAQGDPLNGTASGPTAGVLSYTGTRWTDTQAASVSSLPDSNGNITSVGFVANGSYNGNEGVGTSVNVFRSGEYAFSADTLTLTISGLTSGTNYDLVIDSNYTDGNLYGGGAITLTGASAYGTQTSTGTTTPTSFINGTDYVEFDNVQADGSGDLTATFAPAAGETKTGIELLSGFQIGKVVAAPEPSTYALMGLGALALLVVSRRRRPFLEIHNPTDKPLTTRVWSPTNTPTFGGMSTTVDLPAGNSVILTIDQKEFKR